MSDYEKFLQRAARWFDHRVLKSEKEAEAVLACYLKDKKAEEYKDEIDNHIVDLEVDGQNKVHLRREEIIKTFHNLVYDYKNDSFGFTLGFCIKTSKNKKVRDFMRHFNMRIDELINGTLKDHEGRRSKVLSVSDGVYEIHSYELTNCCGQEKCKCTGYEYFYDDY